MAMQADSSGVVDSDGIEAFVVLEAAAAGNSMPTQVDSVVAQLTVTELQQLFPAASNGMRRHCSCYCLYQATVSKVIIQSMVVIAMGSIPAL